MFKIIKQTFKVSVMSCLSADNSNANFEFNKLLFTETTAMLY